MPYHKCGACKIPILKEDRRRKGDDRWEPCNESDLELREYQAPRVKCGRCGRILIVLKGEFSGDS